VDLGAEGTQAEAEHFGKLIANFIRSKRMVSVSDVFTNRLLNNERSDSANRLPLFAAYPKLQLRFGPPIPPITNRR
jgi:hypothetical protein